jgi:hypothetical protein
VDAVPTPNPNYTNPPVPGVVEGVIDYTKALAGAAGNLSAADLAKLYAGWMIIGGILTPPRPPTRKPYGPIDYLSFGKLNDLKQPGLNPGFIRPDQFYQTTSPIQGQYYWGQHPYQAGTTFNSQAYNQVPGADATPWGLQQMYAPTDINAFVQNMNRVIGSGTAANLPVAGPVAPKV